MLKALTTTVRDAEATDLASFRATRQIAAHDAGAPSVVAEYVASLRGDGKDPYTNEANQKMPREVENDLEMFGCVACNFCITVCPNDAFFSIPSLSDTGLSSMDDSRQQYLVWSELCNECGNCMTFCPENGDPAMIKPRLYTDADVFNSRTTPGVLIDGDGMTARGVNDESFDLVQRLLAAQKGNPLG